MDRNGPNPDDLGETRRVEPASPRAVDVLGKTLDSARTPARPKLGLVEALGKTAVSGRPALPRAVDVRGATIDSGRVAPVPGVFDGPVDVRGATVDSGRIGARPAAAGLDRDMIFAAVEEKLLGRAAESIKLDRFVILDRLGSGGMGVVYAAYDPRLDRKIALKLLHASDMPGTAFFRHSQSMLEREARAAARLSHPNVVTVYDVGTVDTQVYLALEFIDGATLADWLERDEGEEPRPWREVVEMFLEAGRGLIAAHEAGVVHRDFKPENVLIGSDGRPRVADFGLARTASGGAGASAVTAVLSGAEFGASATGPGNNSGSGTGADHTMTAAGTIAGTPAYMSPEQFSGLNVGPASDQFSFCVALYEALFGSRPFSGSTLVELSTAVLEGVREELPKGHRVPPGVVAAVLRGFESAPEDRFPSMEALCAALRRELAPRRRLAIAVGSALVLGAAGIGTAVGAEVLGGDVGDPCIAADTALDSVWNAERRAAVEGAFAATGRPYAADVFTTVATSLDAYAASWTAARRDACEDTRVRGEQSEQLLDLRMACLDRRRTRLETLTNSLGGDVDETAILRAPAATQDLGALSVCEDPEFLLDARRGGRYSANDLPPSQREVFERAVNDVERAQALLRLARYDEVADLVSGIRSAVAETNQPWLGARALRLDADIAAGQGRHDDALKQLDQAIWRGVAAGDDEGVAKALLQVADVQLAHRRETANALESLDRVAPLLAQLPWVRVEQLRASHLRGKAVRMGGEFAEAVEILQPLLARAEKELGSAHELSLDIAQNLASAFIREGRHAQALAMLETIVRASEGAFGRWHPRTADNWLNLGVAHVELEQFEQAEAAYLRALEIRRKLGGEKSVEVASIHNNLGELFWQQKAYSKARESHARSLEIRTRILDEGHPHIGISHYNIGEIELAGGRYDEAAQHLDAARSIFVAKFGDGHPFVALTDVRRGQAMSARGDASAAKPLLESSLAVLKEKGGDKDWIADGEFALAAVLWAEGDKARARELAGSARATYESLKAKADEAKAAADWLAAHPVP